MGHIINMTLNYDTINDTIIMTLNDLIMTLLMTLYNMTLLII